jgi:LytS/YehU family sensor histidine kinase
VGALVLAAVIAVLFGRELLFPGENPTLWRPAFLSFVTLLELGALSWAMPQLEARWSSRAVLIAGALGALGLVLGTFALIGLGFSLAGHHEDVRGLLLITFDGVVLAEVVYVFWIAVFLHPRVAQDAEAAALQAERLREQAELLQLRSHLEPHFILNTLNTIAAFVTEHPSEARRLLGDLGDLLGEALEAPSWQTLEAELAWLHRYAGILESRHGRLLAFRWEIDPKTLALQLPRLLLQPLVENAIKHGALSREHGGVVTICATSLPSGGTRIEVDDDGPGFGASSASGTMLGVQIVQRRVKIECPGWDLRFESSPSGTRAIIEVP